jgi:predicted metal-dependent phosphoesterase TrpH
MIDLHMHTKVSDGSLTPLEVINIAREKGIKYLAITDHDTTKGLKDAVDIGNDMGVNIIPGVEISAYDYKRNKRAHILGLFIEPGHNALEKICRPLLEERHLASKEMVDRIIKAGYSISWYDVEKYASGGTGVYKQHIMHALMDRGYCESIYCSLYNKLFKRCNDSGTQGIAYIPLKYIDALRAIKAVKDARGIAVLAHPGQLDNYDFIAELVEAGLEGIEAYHQSHTEEDVQKSMEFAEKYNLAVTGGSDFHGFYGETPVEPGCGELSDNCISELKRRIKERRGSI